MHLTNKYQPLKHYLEWNIGTEFIDYL